MAQININAHSEYLTEVKLEVGDGEGIGGWGIADQVGAPRLDDLPQFFMVILTEQRRQRCVLVEGLRG